MSKIVGITNGADTNATVVINKNPENILNRQEVKRNLAIQIL